VSLLETAKRYDLAVSKEQRSWFEGLHKRPLEWAAPFPAEQMLYMAQDIEVPCRIAQRQQALIERYGLEAVTRLENEALPAIASMEAHGALIDQARWRQVLHIKRERQAVLERELRDTLGQALYEARQAAYPVRVQRHEAYQQARAAEEK